jgi:hypothetical protein
MLTTAEIALIVSGVALIGTAATVFQKRLADRREAWWGRTQWALERVLADQGGDDDASRTVGLLVLTTLQRSILANGEERKMLDQVADSLLPSPPEAEIS